MWLTAYQVITSPVTGVFRATVRDGYAVAAGEGQPLAMVSRIASPPP